MNRAAIAKDTLRIIEQGDYINPAGHSVRVHEHVDACVRDTRLFLPAELDGLAADLTKRAKPYSQTRFELRNETSLEASHRLVACGDYQNPALLNFASARNPGGGFLNGAQAQEESLARSSGLYASLTRHMEFYEHHRAERSLLYTDRMIYSPCCPVFRKDDGTLLDEAYRISIITSAAPNAGAIRRNQPREEAQIPEVFRGRITKLLALASAQCCDALILGAWGCGAFKNSPALVAEKFEELLAPGKAFFGHFKFVLFAVYDTHDGLPIYSAFEQRVGSFCSG